MQYNHYLAQSPLADAAAVVVLEQVSHLPGVSAIGIVLDGEMIQFTTFTEGNYAANIDCRINDIVRNATATARGIMADTIRVYEESDSSPDREMPDFANMSDEDLHALYTEWTGRTH